MKSFFAVLLSLVISVISGCSGVGDVLGDYPDKAWCNSERNVTLAVFRCGDNYYGRCTVPRDTNGWDDLYGTDGIELADGEFGFAVADVTFMSGGYEAKVNQPTIKRLKKFEKAELSDIEQFCELPEFGSERLYDRGMQLYHSDAGTYCIFSSHARESVEDNGVTKSAWNFGHDIYLNGEHIGRYGTQLEAEAAMGMRTIADEEAEITDEYDKSVYVFRCGDTYLAYIRSIFFNNYWTPLLNEDFENKLPFIELEDGEAAYLTRAHVLKVNGGEAGYVNAPMIVSAESAEKISYDWLTLSAATEHYAETPPDKSSDLREYGVSEYLIFFLDGRYHVYREHDGAQSPVGIYDSISEVDEVLGRNGG